LNPQPLALPDLAKLLMLLGLTLFLLGVLLYTFSRLGFRRLPGDIEYQGQHVHFFFPIATCILLSLLFTALLWLWNWLTRK
jgi:uncharacterized membrane protein